MENFDNLDADLGEISGIAGYLYDPAQDIFYSELNAWQRNFGYCRLYDEASAPLCMIIDCEPFSFEYDGKRWLIEFWKGQYGMTTGAEIGIYTTDQQLANIAEIFDFTFYQAASDEDMLPMKYTLYRDNKRIFTRKDLHWWLTGFRLGEFSEPSQLMLESEVTFKDTEMLNAFYREMRRTGYRNSEIHINGLTISFLYKKPRTPQPLTRQSVTDWLIQRSNEKLCEEYEKLTRKCRSMPEKLSVMRNANPKFLEHMASIGKHKEFYESGKTQMRRV